MKLFRFHGRISNSAKKSLRQNLWEIDPITFVHFLIRYDQARWLYGEETPGLVFDFPDHLADMPSKRNHTVSNVGTPSIIVSRCFICCLV